MDEQTYWIPVRMNRPAYSGAGAAAGPLASDSFTGADAPSLGGNWTTSKGVAESLGIITNQCGLVNAFSIEGDYYSAVAAPNDQYSQATVVALASLQMGVTVRDITSGTTLNAYYAGCNTNDFGGVNTTSRIWKYVAGAATSLGTGATTLAAGQVWRLEIVGTNLTFKINGATEITVSDAAFASGQFGLHGASGSVIALFDNWEGGAP